MMQAGCCCGCSCPIETDLPSSVTVTVTVTGCHGTTAVLTAVAVLNADAPCQIGNGCLCPKYSFVAVTETPNCGGSFLCNMQAETFDSCGTAGDAFIGISSLGIGTNGVGFNQEPYTLCDLWSIRINFSVWIQQPVATIQVANGSCQECYVSQYYPESPCFRIAVSSIQEVVYCKAAGQAPTGTYEDCTGMPHGEVCGVFPPVTCENCAYFPPYIAMTINNITIA
jgi:hypothetical protein